jgi:hypothetical protein
MAHQRLVFDFMQALMTLLETNQDAFFALLASNLTEYLPLVYTPTGDSPLPLP